jgi:hypothetical protein
MTVETITQMVERLAQAEPLTAEHFAARLGAPLRVAEANPYWETMTFELASGPFARGEVRLKATGDAALLMLEPRRPPGLGRAAVDRAGLGTLLRIEPNPQIPPAGVVTEYFQKDEVQVAAEWASDTDRLRSLVLKWEPPAASTAETAPGTTTAGIRRN